ncbi:MAG: hypothetical protein Q7J79_10225, partial [Gemmatimonadales bacterium]|nr:hypothetical protein [Gemmatimonadales bacterium]
LGVSLEAGRTLVIRPCIPRDWPGFTVRLRLPDRRATYEFVVRRAPPTADDRTTASCSDGPVSVEDGTVRVPVAADGRARRVEVLLGRDAAPRYRPKAWDTPEPW